MFFTALWLRLDFKKSHLIMMHVDLAAALFVGPLLSISFSIDFFKYPRSAPMLLLGVRMPCFDINLPR
jgi:hypothetical protein